MSRLYGPGPGDPENLVEGLPLKVLCWLLAPENKGVGGGRSVHIGYGTSMKWLSETACGLKSR